MDIKSLGDQIVSTVKEFVARRLEDVTKRLDEVVARLDALPVPKDGQPGKDADMDVLMAHIKESVEKHILAVRDGLMAKEQEFQSLIAKADLDAKERDKEIHEQLSKLESPKNGDPGRDALDLDVMLAINEGRSYCRGTYATHKGGLWKTIRTTEGMDGWECIVDGLDAVEIEMSGDREVTIKTKLSSGRQVSKSFEMPVILDRGVFKSGRAYKTGDGVSWGGSFWIAQRDTSEKPDIDDSGWRLAVKKGQNGKEVVPIPPTYGPLKIDKGVA